MNPDDISSLMDSMQYIVEALAGFRKQLIDQGFSPEMAEQIVYSIAVERTHRP